MNPISILVADDNQEALEVLGLCLRCLGHDVTCVEGGKAAIQAMTEHDYDLVLTDVLMPDTDGLEVVMAARRSQPGARVIVMTGGGGYFSAGHLLKLGSVLGADDQLMKPFSQHQLVSAIERVFAEQFELAGAA